MSTSFESNLKTILISNFKELVIDTTNNLHFNQCSKEIESSLVKMLKPHYPEVQIYLFGSRIIGTGSHTSDLDIYVDVDQSFYTLGFDKKIPSQMDKVYKLLREAPDKWIAPIKVSDAKIPLIKVVYKHEHINCDISFSDGMGYRNTKLIRTLCDEQPIYKDLIICLRLWMENAELSNDFNNYTLRLLVLHYLQHINMMPPIQLLQESITSPRKIGPWNVDFDVDILRSSCFSVCNDLRTHLSGFFKYYSSSNLTDNIICTYRGTLVPTVNFASGNENHFEGYYDFVKIHKNETYNFSYLNIRGPFHFGQNPARNVSSKALQKFINLSTESYTFLNNSDRIQANTNNLDI